MEVVPSGSMFEGLMLGSPIPGAPDMEYTHLVEHLDHDYMLAIKKYTVYEDLEYPEGLLEKDSMRTPLLMLPSDHAGYVRIQHQDLSYLRADSFREECSRVFLADKFKNIHGQLISTTNSGPAVTIVTSEKEYGYRYAFDVVWCIRCTGWPSQAQEWAKRKRTGGWPSQQVLEHVLKDACHVVPVGPSGDIKKGLEWRLSFSKAEQTLIKSLTLIQKEIYVCFKNIAKNASEPKLCFSYCLKTIFLWSCEKIPQEHWHRKNFAKLLFYLIDQLIHHFTVADLPHFFIPENNLLTNTSKHCLLTAAKKLVHIRNNPIDNFLKYAKSKSKLIGKLWSFDDISEWNATQFETFIKISNLVLCILLNLQKCFKHSRDVLASYTNARGMTDTQVVQTAPMELINAFRQTHRLWKNTDVERILRCLAASLSACSNDECLPELVEVIISLAKLFEISDGVLYTQFLIGILTLIKFDKEEQIKLVFDSIFEQELSRKCYIIQSLLVNLQNEAISIATHQNDHDAAVLRFKLALFLAAAYMDQEKVIKPLCHCVLKEAYVFLEDKQYMKAMKTYEFILNYIADSDHSDEYIVSIAAGNYANLVHIFSYEETNKNSRAKMLQTANDYFDIASEIEINYFKKCGIAVEYANFMHTQDELDKAIRCLEVCVKMEDFESSVVYTQQDKRILENHLQSTVNALETLTILALLLAHYYLARCYMSSKNTSQSKHVLETLEKLADDPRLEEENKAMAFLLCAFGYLNLKNYTDARRVLKICKQTQTLSSCCDELLQNCTEGTNVTEYVSS